MRYANSLVTGVYFFNLPKENLKEAKEILLHFRGVKEAERLIVLIEDFNDR